MTAVGVWAAGGRSVDIAAGLLVGVVNVTPDSFSDGGRFIGTEMAVAHARTLVADGAGVIDVGGESTRPGATPVPVEVEAQRVLPIVAELARSGDVVSIDTYEPETAARALDSGALIVNDITGFENRDMVEVVAGNTCGVVVMCGREAGIDRLSDQSDVTAEVENYLLGRVECLIDAGVGQSRIVIDPGLGFAKTPAQSIELLSGLGRLARHGLPVMIGASRKGFLRQITDTDSWRGRDEVTALITALAFAAGASVFRVHDVARSRDALEVTAAIVAHH